MHGIPGGYLYAKLIMPDGISYASGYDPPASGSVLFTDKFRIFLLFSGSFPDTVEKLEALLAQPGYLEGLNVRLAGLAEAYREDKKLMRSHDRNAL